MINKLPKFPKEKDIVIDDRAIIEKFTSKFPPYSDFNFTSMFCWDSKNEFKISNLNDNIIIKFNDYLSDNYFYSVLGEKKIDDTIDELLDASNRNGFEPKLQLVPEVVIQNISNNKKFTITSDRDNYDYIYSIKDSLEMEGSRYFDYRKYLNKFTRNYGDRTEVRIIGPDYLGKDRDALNLFRTWKEVRQKSDQETLDELSAIKKLLDNYRSLGVKTMGIFIDDKLVAFCIYEVIKNSGNAILHFEKADVRYDRISYFIRNEIIKILEGEGCELVNSEQDLGIHGLRRAKEKLRPESYLKKYTISRA